MKNIRKINSLVTASLLLFVVQILTGCGAMKSVSMLNSSEALQDPNIPFQKIIPVEMKAHMLLVDVRINDLDKTFKFIIDTGSITVLTERTAKNLHFSAQNDITMKDITGNSKETKLVIVKKLGIPGLEVGSLAAVVTNLDQLDPQIDGILGSNYLQYFCVNVDFQKPSLSLSNVAPAVPTGTMVIPFEKNMKFGFAPTAECHVDGVSIPCMIDTGDPMNFSIPSSKITKLPGYKGKHYIQSKGSLSYGLYGNADNDIVVHVARFQMGDLELTDLAMISNNSEDGVMTIGKDFLDDYTVSIDYRNSNLYLSPQSNTPKTFPIFTYGFGIGKDKEGTTRVNGVWEKSPGSKAGIEIGDEILSINGKAAGQLSMLQLLDMLLNKQRVHVKFKKQSGEEKLFILDREDLSKRVNR